MALAPHSARLIKEKSSQRLVIRGNLEVPRGARALVFVIDESRSLAQTLYSHRFAVCHVETDKLADVRAEIRHCQTRVALPAFLVGADLAIRAAKGVPNLRGVVAFNPSANRDVIGAASRLDVPLLVIGNSSEVEAAVRDVTTLRIAKVRREHALAAAVIARFIGVYS